MPTSRLNREMYVLLSQTVRGFLRPPWWALDAALTSQGAQIALLIRLAPVAPMVLTNILLSLTSISQFTYLWTCAIGIVPANLPYAYAAQVGVSIANEFPPKDPFMLIMTVVGLVASIAIAWKIGVMKLTTGGTCGYLLRVDVVFCS